MRLVGNMMKQKACYVIQDEQKDVSSLLKEMRSNEQRQ